MRVTKLRVSNFKRFADATFDLQPFNVIVGPNNSGKSTLLQAMSLLQFCIRSTLRKRNSSYELASVSLGQEEFAVIPVAEALDLWKDRRAQRGGKHIKIEIEADLSNGAGVRFPIDLTYNRFGIQPELKRGRAEDLVGLNIIFIPGYVGFLPREERRTPAIRQGLIAQGRHGEIIRNILLDLREAPESYAAFRSLLNEVFPDIEMTDPMFDEKTDLYIQVRYLEDGTEEERRRRGIKELDLISAGSGFHQFLQIFSNMLQAKPSTLLLDEPDAHLYANLQREILRMLHTLVRDGKMNQVLLATHSAEVITRVQANEILLVGAAAPRRLSERADIPPVLESLGSVDNLALLQMRISGRVVITEDKRDGAILERFLRTLWGDETFQRFAARVVFLPLNGSPLARDIGLIQNALQHVIGAESPLKLFVICDRDYLFDDERAERLARGNRQSNQQWVIWERAEIENYLMNLAPLQRICEQECSRARIPAVREGELRSKLEVCVESSRTVVLDKLMNRFHDQDRRREPATCRKLAEDFLDQQWRGDRRVELCDAKEVVLPCLRNWLSDTFGISVSDVRLAMEFTRQEVPDEIREVADRLRNFAEA
jgi:predicted ATPase